MLHIEGSHFTKVSRGVWGFYLFIFFFYDTNSRSAFNQAISLPHSFTCFLWRFIWICTKAMLSIFYGRRVLRLALIVPNKKKKLDFQRFLGKQLFVYFFSSHITEKPLSGSVDHRIYWAWPNLQNGPGKTSASLVYLYSHLLQISTEMGSIAKRSNKNCGSLLIEFWCNIKEVMTILSIKLSSKSDNHRDQGVYVDTWSSPTM